MGEDDELVSRLRAGDEAAFVALVDRYHAQMVRFAETLERVCVETVEAGHMTKDLAILVGPEQPWMTTEQFFEAVRTSLEAAMASAVEPQETAPARA